MRQVLAILFVLSFALAGNSQVTELANKQFNTNLISIDSSESPGQHAIFYQANFFDESDSKDLNGLNCISILPNKYRKFYPFELIKISNDFHRLGTFPFNELLFDLPPPMLSVS